MGTGKSTLARILAERWRRPYADTDLLIEGHTQMSIPKIFETSGEAGFRELERQCIEKWIPRANAVVACGGGLVMPPGMLELLKSIGIIICLFARPETVLRRTSHSVVRPLLCAAEPEARIRELMAQREEVYLRAGAGVYTDGRCFSELAIAVERIYRRQAKGWKDAPAAVRLQGSASSV
jgi:shikimate kinase